MFLFLKLLLVLILVLFQRFFFFQIFTCDTITGWKLCSLWLPTVFSVSFGMKTSLAGVGSLKYLEEICVDIATFYENANNVM